MTFQDVKSAIKMRNTIISIAEGVVNRMRPEERIGKVFSIDESKQTAKVYFPGEDISSLVEAHYSMNMIPRVFMITDYSTLGYDALGDIVRVAGKPGSYYIIDYVSGVPAGTVLPGMILDWPAAAAPSGFFLANGGTFQSTSHPVLALLLGDVFGTHTGTTYYLPNYNGRTSIGVGTATGAAGATAHTLGQKAGEETHVLTAGEGPTHSHTASSGTDSPDHYHNSQVGFAAGYNTADWELQNGTGLQFARFNVLGGEGASARHTHTVTVNNTTGTGNAHNNMQPYIGMYKIIKGG